MGDLNMAEATSKVPVKAEQRVTPPEAWRPFESLRHEVNRLFEDFDRDFWRFPGRRSFFGFEPFRQRELTLASTPAVDIVEKDTAYEVSVELPGMDEKNIEVKLANGGLTIKGEKQEEKEEKKKDYYLQERRFGSFERRFEIPEGVDASKIEANFAKGVLTVTLPKSAEAKKAAQKIAVKAA
jgi:HSP20 family protein